MTGQDEQIEAAAKVITASVGLTRWKNCTPLHFARALIDAGWRAPGERGAEVEHVERIANAVAKVTPCSCSAQRTRAEKAEAEVERLRVRERLIVAQLWQAWGCAHNPDDFKDSVRDTLVRQMTNMAREAVQGDTRIFRENQSLQAEVERLQRWKDEALPVIAGLQELGKALDMPPGTRITGPEAAKKAQALVAEVERLERVASAVAMVTPCSCSAQRTRAEKAEAKVARVEAKVAEWDKRQPSEWPRWGSGRGIAAALECHADELRAALADDPASDEGGK